MERPVFAGPVADVDGNKRYELGDRSRAGIGGRGGLRQVRLRDRDRAGCRAGAFDERSKRFLKRHLGDRKPGAPRLDDITALLDLEPPRLPENLKDGVVVYLRPTEGAGTFWGCGSRSWVCRRECRSPSFFPESGRPGRLCCRWRGTRTSGSFATCRFRRPWLPLSAAFPGGRRVLPRRSRPLPWAQFHPWHLLFSGVSGTPSATNFGVGGHSVPWFF